MGGKQLTTEELSEVYRYSVWVARLSASLKSMTDIVDSLAVVLAAPESKTVQERNKTIRLALEDLRLNRDDIARAIEELEKEYQDRAQPK